MFEFSSFPENEKIPYIEGIKSACESDVTEIASLITSVVVIVVTNNPFFRFALLIFI